MILHGEAIQGVKGAPGNMKGKISFYTGATPIVNPEKKLPVDCSSMDSSESCVLMMEFKKGTWEKKDHFFGLPVDQVIGIDEIPVQDIAPAQPNFSVHESGNPVGMAEVNQETVHIVDPEKLVTPQDMKLFLEACQSS